MYRCLLLNRGRELVKISTIAAGQLVYTSFFQLPLTYDKAVDEGHNKDVDKGNGPDEVEFASIN